MVIFIFSIPVWVFLVVILLALGFWELFGGIINNLICAVLLFIIAFTFVEIVVGIIDLFKGDKSNHLVLDGEYWGGLLAGLAISLLGGSLMYSTYIEPYIIKETGREKILIEPEKEIQAVGELVRIEGNYKCSAFFAHTKYQYDNYVHCIGKKGEVTLYSGRNYKYLVTSTKDTDGCKVYADDKLVAPEYDDNIQMSVYEIDNCEELRFEFSRAMELSETWVYRTSYPTQGNMENQ